MNKLIIVSGPSGCGKTTVMRNAMGVPKPNEVVSTTTRAPRQGEVDGQDYYYVSDEVFAQWRELGLFAEYSSYYGRSNYGITHQELASKLEKGIAFVIVDIEGKRQLEELLGPWETVSIFFVANKFVAGSRMLGRGDSPADVNKRLNTFDTELQNIPQYDYVVVNEGSLQDAVADVRRILTKERLL